jgi:hypothetical protein
MDSEMREALNQLSRDIGSAVEAEVQRRIRSYADAVDAAFVEEMNAAVRHGNTEAAVLLSLVRAAISKGAPL